MDRRYADMRIKKLEIAGFKSFADRARLQFDAGITGVVGPNGCGKSNIVDAIRWCMGEMSAKHLRGRAMQDVIFAGSDNHGPLGMAEVTLVFDNTGKDGDAPQRPNYSEIAVTRRLFRDGTSEYLINKVPVRLRDVTDLFLGTGVGTRAYSIIEQGRIGFVVNSRPEDRRTLIEEVAGITKFKVRKKAAERRMESTEQNLQRVNDVVGELERQLASLRRQAQKAERYKKLRAELRDLELHDASLEVLRLSVVTRVHEGERRRIEQDLGVHHADVIAGETELEAARERAAAEERRLRAEQSAVSELDAADAALRSDVGHWREQQVNARQRGEQAELEVKHAEQRIAQTEAEQAQLQDEYGQVSALEEADVSALAQARRTVETLQDQLVAVDEELEILRRDALEHVQGAAKQRALAASLARQQHDTRARQAQAAQERHGLLPRQAQLETRRVELTDRGTGLATDLGQWRAQVAAWKTELPELREACRRSGADVNRRKEELGQRRSRLASLQEIVRRLDGYSDGVRNLLGPRSRDHQIGGLRGLVAEILEVPPELERAIESVLGERLQYLLVDHVQVGQSAIDLLKTRRAGRSGFIPWNLSIAAPPPNGVPDGPGILGRALDRVQVSEDYRGIANFLLSNVLLVDSLATAISLGEYAVGWTCVTPDGDVAEAGQIVAGGAASSAGLLANRREIRELTRTVETLTAALAEAEAAHQALEEQRLQREVDLNQLGKDIHAAELEAVKVSKDREAAETELKRIGERLQMLANVDADCETALGRLDAEANAAVEAATAAEAGHQDVEWRLAEAQERRQVQAQQLQRQSEELMAVQVRMAARQEKVASIQTTLQRLQAGLQDLHERVQRGRAMVAESRQQTDDLDGRIATGEQTLAAQSATLTDRRAALDAAARAYEEECARLRETEQTIKERRRDAELLHEALLAAKMALQKLALERQTLLDHTRERHDVELLAIVGDYHLRPPLAAAQHKRMSELERSIRAMGAINLSAIEECADVEQRCQFLIHQRDDLQQALDALKRAITSINRASRERFREAFDAVNEMFQKVYPRLFRGGVARLELTESDDLLDAGVDIIAQPPGKKLQSVQLLSGGEKALTATALVFAIFLIKPSPFCILDEVDAPLDEANVGRFNDLLQEIAKISQFIVITHNKQTMLKADRLYGITMEEPGRSKVVAVDLEGKQKDAAA